MDISGYQRLYEQETTPEALEATSQYIARQLKPFLQIMEPVLVCFPDDGPASLGAIFKRAVELCDATAILWGPDYRWKELLRLAFDTHANTVIAHPLVALGLVKLARATSTPLYIYDFVLGGYPYPRWLVEGVKKGLDCRMWGCYAAKAGAIITGFTCEKEAGIHIRDDVFELLVSEDGENQNRFPRRVRIRFASKANPDIVYDPQETAEVRYQYCSCGCDAPRFMETRRIGAVRKDILLEETLLDWASILDYRVSHTNSGMKLELVVFPGEVLPELPTCAQLQIRPWDPERDVPLFMADKYPNIPEKHS